MKRIFLLLPFLILFQENAFSQGIESVWISSHIRTINTPKKKSNNTDKQSYNYDSLMLEEVVEVLDTSINEVYALLDFKNSNEVILKGIGGISRIGKYKKRNHKLTLKIENEKFKGRVDNDKVIVSFKYSKYRKEEIIFEKIRDSELKPENIPDSSSFHNSHWKVITDTSSINYGLNFHFLDSNSVIITRDYGKIGSTNWGEFNIDSYGNHLFLGVANRNYGENYFFNIYKQQDETYFANTYEIKLFTYTPPPLVNLKLVKVPLLSNSELDSIKNKLIGSWSAINDPIPCESNKYDLENQYFKLEFENDKFRIIKGGNFNYGNRKDPKEVIIEGNWELSPTGQYLKLNPDNSWTKYVSINVLKMDYAEFYLMVKAIEEPLYHSQLTEFKKNYKP